MSKESHGPVGRSHHRTSGGKAAGANSAGHDTPEVTRTADFEPQRPRVSASPRLSFRSPRLILFLIVAVVLLYGVIYPNIHVVLASLQTRRQLVASQLHPGTLAGHRAGIDIRECRCFDLDSLAVRCHRRSARVPVRALHVPGQPLVRDVRCPAVGFAAARRHRRFYFSLWRVRHPRSRDANSLSPRAVAVVAARLAGVAAVPHLHHVSVFLHAHRRGVDAHRRRAGGSRQKFGRRSSARVDPNSLAATHAVADCRGLAHVHDFDGFVQRSASFWRRRARADTRNLHGATTRRREPGDN